MANRTWLFRISTAFILLASGALPGATNGQSTDLQVSTTLSTKTAFVNEQVLLSRKVDANPAAFSITGTGTPQTGNADILPLVERKRATDSGQTISTRWAIFAHEIGEVTIDSHVFQATMPASGGSNPIIQNSSAPLKLRILPAPQSPTDTVWLPAKALTIEQQWVQNSELVLGEPKTLLVTITAIGQRAAAIPPLVSPTIDGLRWYTLAPTLNDRRDESGVTGVRTERFTVVAQRSGFTEIPPFSIGWFDTVKRAWRKTQSNALSLGMTNVDKTAKPESAQWWVVLSVALALITVGLAVFHRYRRPTELMTWRRVNRALRADNPTRLRQAVVDWSAQRWPSEKKMGIEQLAALLSNTELQQAILELNGAAYGRPAKDRAHVSDGSLKLALQTLRNRGLENTGDVASLAALYPVSSRR